MGVLEFQSLIGILLYFNQKLTDRFDVLCFEFQSLIGILLYFNVNLATNYHSSPVSIPDRDFIVFQQWGGLGRCPRNVFQSLIGILLYFNEESGAAIEIYRRFNP